MAFKSITFKNNYEAIRAAGVDIDKLHENQRLMRLEYEREHNPEYFRKTMADYIVEGLK